ncbi:unnamed protein product [Acanthocheilonema viteae]|uniref:Major facilitator superfamily (MFS) profile domain-containing protein n=1 Tax=Acanthocheilonema viteae TaxID=6277 RepID=A0A498SQ14_ACAVI|nr:unnamed protein product [Acanthocheilonema viteae]
MNKNLVPLLIFIVLVFDLLAFTSILPLFPIIIDYYGLSERRDQLYDAVEMFCQFFQNAIGTPSSERLHSVFFGGMLGSLYCLLQFLSSPLLGALSDIFGRKPILLFSIAGTLISYVIWNSASNFTFFLLSRVIGGLSKASVSICIAIMADVYSKNKVVQGMAIIGAAFSVGFLIGPMVGVYFSRNAAGANTELAINAPAKFGILLSIIELVFVALILPETLHISQRKTLINEVLKNCLLYIKPSALFQFAAIGDHSGGIRRIPNNKQHITAIYGISFTIPAYIIIGYSNSVVEFYVGLAFYAIASGLVVPCLTSCISNEATDDVKGVTIGVFRCLGALARAIGPLFASTVFWLLGSTVCYVVGGILLIIPIFMLRHFSPGAAAMIKKK